MTNSTMAKEITTKAIETLENEKKIVAQNWCDTIAEEAVTVAASNRCKSVKVNAEYNGAQQVRGQIEAYLKENGYQVEWLDQGRMIEISWF